MKRQTNFCVGEKFLSIRKSTLNITFSLDLHWSLLISSSYEANSRLSFITYVTIILWYPFMSFPFLTWLILLSFLFFAIPSRLIFYVGVVFYFYDQKPLLVLFLTLLWTGYYSLNLAFHIWLRFIFYGSSYGPIQ